MNPSPSYSTTPWINQLAQAYSRVQAVDFIGVQKICAQIIYEYKDNPIALLDVGSLLLNIGFISNARKCFERVTAINCNEFRADLNLANCARDGGDHKLANDLYLKLQRQQPNDPIVRRNVLISQQYNPEISDLERIGHAKAWGEWAITQAGGPRPRPRHSSRPIEKQTTGDNSPIRVGYVSADFCQHTVGLFIKDVMKAHTSRANIEKTLNPIEVFAYSSGQVVDWVTHEVRSTCTFRDVSRLDDMALASLIRKDRIDVLVDLSGHTAGSRLTVFAHRPAPVQISWLGYFATTGLRYIDAVFLDNHHAPYGSEDQFIEDIIRLEGGRFCYQPVPWAPETSPPPSLKLGYVTFGSFNNTGKLNVDVFEVWAKILQALPTSRLVLKWRTLIDEALSDDIHKKFEDRGISAKRVELRPASFHVDVLKEYADIDVALDPFPFTGGLTSCEALWMGLPVITMPKDSIVSRQTFAILSAIGKTQWVAKDSADYVKIAQTLAADTQLLAKIRASLRKTMRASPLMDVDKFTQNLQQAYYQIYDKINMQEKKIPTSPKTVLHVGSGHKSSGAKLPEGFSSEDWQEIRLDIDPSNEPDILGSMLDMSALEDNSVDAIYSAHNIEHVFTHEVPLILGEFKRVLKPNGFALITCPDLKAVCALIADNKLTEAAYNSKAGPITPLDILYGHTASLVAGNHFMAHKTGFTEKSLTQALVSAGFTNIATVSRSRGFDIWALATKGASSNEKMKELALKFIPF
jgi:hypothetical protein